jgi:hypothetical protein
MHDGKTRLRPGFSFTVRVCQRRVSAPITNNVNTTQLTTVIKIATYEYLAIANYCELLLFDAVCCALSVPCLIRP